MSTSAEKQHFNVPKDYFVSLKQRCMQRVLDPNQDASIQKRNKTFNLPENYFSELKSNILAKTSEKKTTRVYSLYTWSAAASIALLFLAVWVYTSNQKNQQTQWSSLSELEMTHYIENALLETPSLELTELNQDPVITMGESDFFGELPIDDYLELTVPSAKEWQHYEEQ
jgi:hypothetical protein